MRVLRTVLLLLVFMLSSAAAAQAAPTLTPVDGGSGYYGKFANSLSDSPGYFPVGVWGSYNHTQANRDLDAAAGINLYVWLADPCNGASAVRADGRFKVFYEESENRSCAGSETAAWMLGDEIDMCCGPPGFVGGNGYNILTSRNSSLPTDGKMRYTNYGKGIVFWEDDPDAARFVNLPFLKVVSDDVYWMTDDDACSAGQGGALFGLGRSLTQAECRRGYNYGAVVAKVRRLDAMDGSRKPIYNLVETGCPMSNGKCITPGQMRSAAWHSIIAGARGVVWFEHSFSGPSGGDHHTLRTNSNGTRSTAVSVDAQIKSLAPVLNAPTVTGLVEFSPGLATLAKWQDNKFYVFAGRIDNGPSSSFTVSAPCVGQATAVVDGESRSVPVVNGQITDTFADGNAVHIYRIDGGSTCGLGVDPSPSPTPTATPTATPPPPPPPTPTATPEPTPAPFDCATEPVCADWKARALKAEDQVTRIRTITGE